MTPLIIALLQNVIVPEVIVAIKAHYAAKGTMPTEAEVMAALDLTAASVIRVGEDWLAAHPTP